MIDCYGVFCGHYNEGMSFYKEQMQSNKKLQILMRVSSVLPINVQYTKNNKSKSGWWDFWTRIDALNTKKL